MLGELSDRRGRFVLEDVQRGKAIIGADPFEVLTAHHGRDPFATLADQLARFRQDHPTLDAPFAGGAVGCFSYDLGRSIERLPSLAREDVPTPDFHLGLYDSALCVDSRAGVCTAVSWSGDTEAIADWRALALTSPETPSVVDHSPVRCADEPVELDSNFTKTDYLAAVDRVKDYIAAGDVYQVNLSQRFHADLPVSPLEVYLALRRVNPAPKACFVEMGDLTLVSATPETFLVYDPNTRLITTKPIKGTRPRGRGAEEDARLAHELHQSEKDRAENVMIVDMLRNDIGRVAEYGTVRVPRLYDIETHPNVFQMVSTVEAELAEPYGPVDLVKACFPGGSITGAPKVRAMEIIEELEPYRRGLYTGSAGYMDFRGHTDLSIIIRSFITKGSTAYFHAGGGIVADSDPEMEYQETLDKISGLRLALRECAR